MIDLNDLNEVQREAVMCVDTPSLVIAGAGSGKTKVLTYKIAYLLEMGVRPGEILALTFTNKASGEMKTRISQLTGRDKAVRLWMGTFHSIFIRFLREYAQLIGYPESFSVYDSADSKSLMRHCIKDLELDDKMYKANDVLSRISVAKNNLITAQAYINNSQIIQNDVAMKKGRICDLYLLYDKKCRQAGAMDFDDILLNMNILLRDFPQVADTLKRKFKYILVDEYQDTNYAQYLIVKKISSENRNITVVGDDSQSIYAFRGAKIENILNFKKDYPEAKEFRLEQNYRSTQVIVNASNSLISKNSMRLKKDCFSMSEEGEKVGVIKAFTEQEEAFMIASSIIEKIYSCKASYDNFAILYRTNAQSRAIEEALRKKNLPYKIYAGHSFYQRQEVRDLLAYFRLVINIKDDEAFRRIVNVPARGIGNTSLSSLNKAAVERGVSMFEAIYSEDLESYGLKNMGIVRLRSFAEMINELRKSSSEIDAYNFAVAIANVSGYLQMIKSDTSLEGESRLANVEELINSVKEFIEEQEMKRDEMLELGLEDSEIDVEFSLESFIENVSLISDLDNQDDDKDTNKIKLMTVHSSKGLEFPYVYIAGMEESLFPSTKMGGSESEIEEERRLFYVALTRAMKQVTVSFSKSRFRWGTHVNYPPSRFLREIDGEYLEKEIDGDQGERELRGVMFKKEITNDKYNQRREGTVLPSNFKKVTTTTFSEDINPDFKQGQRVEHDRFGEGVIIEIEGEGSNMKVIVEFDTGGRKTLLIKFAKIRIIQ